MKALTPIFAALLATTLSVNAQSLALGPDQFAAAKNLACVLAQESLGYLSEDEYATLSDEALDGFSEQEVDVIRAKALGYYDGLMFGLPSTDEQQVNERLREFVESRTCTVVIGYRGVNLTL